MKGERQQAKAPRGRGEGPWRGVSVLYPLRFYFFTAFCLLAPLAFFAKAEEDLPGTASPKVGEILPIPLVDDENHQRTGLFTVDTGNSDVLLMVYSLSQSPGSHSFRLSLGTGSSKKARPPAYARKPTIPTATAYAEYYFRQRLFYLDQFLNDLEPSSITLPRSSRDFWVRRIEDPNNFIRVSADLKFNGQKCLIYLDKTLSEEFISPEQIVQIGSTFDNKIYPAVQTYFGTESDVNRDTKITVLVTGLVSTHAAFFDQKDLFPEVAYSNGQEIIFLRVPLHPVPIDFFTTTLAHEFQHLVTFNQRVFLRHSYPEERWLDEGLSYMAEYLTGNSATVTHAYSFLSAPQNFSLVHFTRAYGENQGTLGAIYLFMRYLVDRYGESILAKLTQTDRRGIANVEAATGVDFAALYRDWIAALFLSDTGLNSNPIFNYRSLKLRSLQPSVQIFRVPIRYFLNGPAEKVLDLRKARTAERPLFEGSVEAIGVQYLRLRGSEEPVPLKLVGSQESKLEAALIYLPKGYKLVPQAPAEIIEDVILDAPLPLLYPAGKKMTLSGKVLNPDVKKVGLRFEPQDGNSGRENLTFWSLVDAEGTFKLKIKFPPKYKGDFLMGMGLFVNPEEAPVKENIWVKVE